MISVVYGGTLFYENERWSYKVSSTHVGMKSKGFLIREDIAYEALVKKIAEKIEVDLCTYNLKLSYLIPENHFLPPYNVSDKEDLDAFVFLNAERSKDTMVLTLPLYVSLDVRKSNIKDEEGEEEMIDVPSSAPENLSQDIASPGCKSNPQKRTGGDLFMDFLEDDDELGCTVGTGVDCDRILVGGVGQDVRSWFCKKRAKTIEFISISSDEEGDTNEEVFISARKHKGCELVNLSDGEDDDIGFVDYHPKVEVKEEGDYSVGVDELNGLDDVELDEVGALVGEGSSSCPLCVGKIFHSKKAIQEALTQYALKNHFEMRVKRSSRSRYVVVCKMPNCSFGLRATVRSGTSSFEVKSFVEKHSCALLNDHNHSRHATASVISKFIIKR